MHLTQTCTHEVDLEDLGPFTLARFSFGDPARRKSEDNIRLLATEEVQPIVAAGVDVVDKLADLPAYTPVTRDFLGRFLNDTPLEEFDADPYLAPEGGVEALLEELLAERGAHRLLPQDAVRYNPYVLPSVWPLPSVSSQPLSYAIRVRGFQTPLGRRFFDMDLLRQLLERSPFVVKVVTAEDSHSLAYGHGLTLDVRLPQSVFEGLAALRQQGQAGGPGAVAVGRPDVAEQLLWPLVRETADRPASVRLPDGTIMDADLFGVRPALLPEDRRLSDDSYDED